MVVKLAEPMVQVVAAEHEAVAGDKKRMKG
jgi:hypothetical protein